jgi:hypothetical protein
MVPDFRQDHGNAEVAPNGNRDTTETRPRFLSDMKKGGAIGTALFHNSR